MTFDLIYKILGNIIYVVEPLNSYQPIYGVKILYLLEHILYVIFYIFMNINRFFFLIHIQT